MTSDCTRGLTVRRVVVYYEYKHKDVQYMNQGGISRKLLIITLAVVIVVSIGVIAIVVLRAMLPGDSTTNQSQPSTSVVSPKTVCSNGLLEKADAAIVEKNIEALTAISDDIKALEEYERDPNCLYAVLQLSILTSDAFGASETLAMLERVYTGTGLSTVITSNTRGVSGLRDDVATLKANQLELEANQADIDASIGDLSSGADALQEESSSEN